MHDVDAEHPVELSERGDIIVIESYNYRVMNTSGDLCLIYVGKFRSVELRKY